MTQKMISTNAYIYTKKKKSIMGRLTTKCTIDDDDSILIFLWLKLSVQIEEMRHHCLKYDMHLTTSLLLNIYMIKSSVQTEKKTNLEEKKKERKKKKGGERKASMHGYEGFLHIHNNMCEYHTNPNALYDCEKFDYFREHPRSFVIHSFVFWS